MRVLIVEDEKDLANVLSEMLELEGYHTDIANDGEYGLDCAMTGIYDLIILDIMRPNWTALQFFANFGRNRSALRY